MRYKTAIILTLVLAGCSLKKVALDQSYIIEFQRKDISSAEKKRFWKWQDREIETVGDNYVRGTIKGVSSIGDLNKLKDMIETLKFTVMSIQIKEEVQESSPTLKAN